jgi:outer membrane lipoprotein SlyB
MSKRFLILAALIMAAILVSGCCCCCTSDRNLYSPANPTIRPSATVIKATVVPVNNVTLLPSPTVPVVTP